MYFHYVHYCITLYALRILYYCITLYALRILYYCITLYALRILYDCICIMYLHYVFTFLSNSAQHNISIHIANIHTFMFLLNTYIHIHISHSFYIHT